MTILQAALLAYRQSVEAAKDFQRQEREKVFQVTGIRIQDAE